MESRICGIYIQVEIEQVDDEGDPISRRILSAEEGRPLLVPLLRSDLKKIQGLEEALARKGVKVV